MKEKKKKYLDLKRLPYDDNSQDVKLVQGMPIISRINNKELEIVNNQTFIITKIDFSNGTILAVDEDQEIEIAFNDFAKLFNVAFCITIHKSQGSTFNEKYCIHEFEKLDKRLKYVALSRSTDIKKINIA